MKLKSPFLSVVVPVYNEAERIKNLEKIVTYFRNKFPTEVIAVNDGSTDKTLDRLQKLKKRFNSKIISYNPNRGKGFALKQGILSAQGKFILLSDIDLSTPLDQFEKFITHLKNNQMVIGTRKNSQAKVLKHQSFLRENLGKGFTNLSNLILDLNISDFTCGFKCFPNKLGKAIFNKVTINRWGYDSEVLFIAKKMGVKIKEVPVVWINDPRSKVKFPQDLINSFLDLLRIRLNDFFKKY